VDGPELDEELVVDHPPHLHQGKLKLLVGEDGHLAALRVHPSQIVLLRVQPKTKIEEEIRAITHFIDSKKQTF